MPFTRGIKYTDFGKKITFNQGFFRIITPSSHYASFLLEEESNLLIVNLREYYINHFENTKRRVTQKILDSFDQEMNSLIGKVVQVYKDNNNFSLDYDSLK